MSSIEAPKVVPPRYGDAEIVFGLALAKYETLRTRGPFWRVAGGPDHRATVSASWAEIFTCQYLVARGAPVAGSTFG